MTTESILFLTCHLPYPAISGGRMREYQLLKRLARHLPIHLCALSKTYEEDIRNTPMLQDLCASVRVFATEPLPQTPSPFPFQVLRHRSPEATRYLREMLATGNVDLLHVEGFYLMQHVPEDCPVPLLLVEQNVEYALWRQRTEASHGEQRKRNLAEYLKTLEAEIAAWKRADMCAAVTPADRHVMLSALPGSDVRVVTNGSDHLLGSINRVETHAEAASVVYVANFAYEPNIDGALFLAEEIWPRISAKVPSARLLLVGNAPPAEILRLAADRRVIVTGRVPEVVPYLDRAAVVVCPLRVGGGVKVKVLEALARGKALVTTPVGVQGLPDDVRDACVVEDDPVRFADAVVRLLRRPRRRAALAERALAFAASLPTWNEAAGNLLACYEALVNPPDHWRRSDLTPAV